MIPLLPCSRTNAQTASGFARQSRCLRAETQTPTQTLDFGRRVLLLPSCNREKGEEWPLKALRVRARSLSLCSQSLTSHSPDAARTLLVGRCRERKGKPENFSSLWELLFCHIDCRFAIAVCQAAEARTCANQRLRGYDAQGVRRGAPRAQRAPRKFLRVEEG